MTTPDSKEAPELKACPFCGGEASVIGIRDGRQVTCKGQPRVPCFAKGPAVFHGPGGWEACERDVIAAWNIRADLVNREPSEGDVERVARAIDDAEFGYSIRLTKLVDGVAEYTLTYPGKDEPMVFDSHAAASDFVTAGRDRARALAAINAWRNP